jgi:serine/threonine protein phosphatase PrpC
LKNEDAPGLAMTRSMGDQVASLVGVVGEPEICELTVTHPDKAIVIASDGVWEFMENQDVGYILI